MGRKKRAGFADISTTRAAFEANEVRCPTCSQRLGPDDNPKFVATFGGGVPTLATHTCARCKTMVSIRFSD